MLFFASAMGHLTQTEGMAAYAGSKGVPAAKLAVIGTGVMLVLGAVSVLLGLWGDLGALLLFLFLVPTALIMHPFWRENDDATKMNEMAHFNKDLALAGAALAFLVLFSLDDLGFTVTGPFSASADTSTLLGQRWPPSPPYAGARSTSSTWSALSGCAPTSSSPTHLRPPPRVVGQRRLPD